MPVSLLSLLLGFLFQNIISKFSPRLFEFHWLVISQEPKMNLRKGSKVWAEDKNLAWVAAEVTDFLAKKVQILTVNGKQVKSWCFWWFIEWILSCFSSFCFWWCRFWLCLRNCVREMQMKRRSMEVLMIWLNWLTWMSLECFIIFKEDMLLMIFMYGLHNPCLFFLFFLNKCLFLRV